MKMALIASLIFFIFIILAVVVVPFVFTGKGHTPSATTTTTTQIADSGFFVSTTGGLTWEKKGSIGSSKENVGDFEINDMVKDPLVSTTFYLVTANRGLWKSTDQGNSWEQIHDKNKVLTDTSQVLRLTIARGNPKLWFVAAYAKNRGILLESQDGGESFKQVYQVPLDRFGVFDSWYSDTEGKLYIATGQGGFLSSTDLGRSWKVVRWFADGLVRILASHNNSNIFYLVSSKEHLFKTTDRGRTWTDITDNLSSFDNSTSNENFVLDERTGELYLGSDYGLLRSSDGGSTWHGVPLIIPPEALPVVSIAVDPQISGIFYISAQSQLYKTTDNGTTWSFLNVPVTKKIILTNVDSKNSLRVYLITTH